MWNKPSKEQLARVPKLYETEATDLTDKVIQRHFFIGGFDWYVAEFDGGDICFGCVNLNDPQNAEWGYFSISELDAIKVLGSMQIDNDLQWQPKKFSEI